MMKHKLILLTALGLGSCSDECFTCTEVNKVEAIEITYCDDGETTYTNAEGSAIEFDTYIELQRLAGMECD